MSSIPYYRVNRDNGRAYWCPTKRMRALGFGSVSLGPAGEVAKQEARVWNARWNEVRGVSVLARRADATEPGGFVYFLHLAGHIKIGVTTSPFQRLQSLAGSSAGPLKRAVVVSGSRYDEQRLHYRFRASRIGGEWFAVTTPLLLSMAECAAVGHVVHDDGRSVPTRESNPNICDRSPSGAESNLGVEKS